MALPQVLGRLEKNKAAYTGFEGIDVPEMSAAILVFLRNYQVRARLRKTSATLAQEIGRVTCGTNPFIGSFVPIRRFLPR